MNNETIKEKAAIEIVIFHLWKIRIYCKRANEKVQGYPPALQKIHTFVGGFDPKKWIENWPYTGEKVSLGNIPEEKTTKITEVLRNLENSRSSDEQVIQNGFACGDLADSFC